MIEPATANRSESEFFAVGDAQLPKAINVQPLDPSDANPVVMGDLTLPRPRTYRKASGTRFYDFLLAGDLVHLISPPARSAFTDLTGWTTFPIAGVGPLKDQIAEYRGLVVLGRCLVDNSKSMLVAETIPGTDRSRARWRGLSIRLDTWTGHDFSLVTDTTIVICTRRVRDRCIGAGLTNVKFTPVVDATNYMVRPNAWEFARPLVAEQDD